MASHIKTSPPLHIANDVYISPNYIILKPQFEGLNFKRSQKQIDNDKNLKDNKHKQDLSKKATGNLRNSINWLIHAAKYKRIWSIKDQKAFWFKVNFITLTIPPQKNELVHEKLFQKCLNTWLVYARKHLWLDNYVWKIEAHEDKRLHVHLTTDTFINYKKLRESWNRILQREGLLDDHFEKFNNYNPNSTDVHAIHKVNKVAAYMCEYMIKKPNLPENYKGRIWSCSYSLSKKNKCHCELEPHYNKRDYSCLNNPALKWKKIESKPDSMGITKKVADMYMLNESDWKNVMSGTIKDTYTNHIIRIRSGTRNSPDEYRTIDMFKVNIPKASEDSNSQIAYKPMDSEIGTKVFTQKENIQFDLFQAN